MQYFTHLSILLGLTSMESFADKEMSVLRQNCAEKSLANSYVHPLAQLCIFCVFNKC